MTLMYLLTSVLLLADPPRGECAKRIVNTDAYRQINAGFPGALTIEGGACRAIEFCPDNTCDAFYAGNHGSPEDLMEYVYVYLFWFSDYFVLQEWRASSDARRVMAHILDAPRNAGCRRPVEKETARCVLRKMAARQKIRVATVRYDEGTRSETRTPLP
jgi:hypothetical protein